MKKRLLRILPFLIIMLLLSGCSNDVKRYYYDFQGENVNWKAEYIVSTIVTFSENKGVLGVDSESEEIFILTYKGELSDLSKVRLFEYGYESPSDSGKSSAEYANDNQIRTKTFKLSSGSKNGSIPNKDKTYTVTVNIDGRTETFELTCNPNLSNP